MLRKNTVTVESYRSGNGLRKIENKSKLESDLLLYARQKPNRKTLGLVKLNLLVYNMFRTNDTTGFKHWMMEHVGEPPIVFDSSAVLSSVSQMQGYLFNKGYLKNEVKASYTIRHRKATVHYTAYPGVQYRLDTLYYPPVNDSLSMRINQARRNTLVSTQAPLDLDLLDREAARLVDAMGDSGYYQLNAANIKYDVDTVPAAPRASAVMRLQYDSIGVANHVFHLRRFNVYTDFDALREAKIPLRDSVSRHYYYYYDSTMVRVPVVQSMLFMRYGQRYSRSDYNYTLNRLSDLGIFKFISIRFTPAPNDSLDVTVRLTPSKRRIVRAELEGNNVESNVGTGVKFTYRNRNWLRRANKLEYNVNGGTEIPLISTGYPLVDGNAQATLNFPRFFAPYFFRHISPYRNPHTQLALALNYQLRAGLYRIGSYNFSYGYQWRNKPRTVQFVYNPFSVSVLESKALSASFQEQLDKDPQLKLSFQNQIITGSNFTFVYTNPSGNLHKSYNYFRGYVETAGFTLWAAQNKSKPPAKDNRYKILDLPYNNYIKIESDYRRYFPLNESRMFIARVFAGTGIHFWNSAAALPYLKQYYAGGSSDIRAWRVRYLGPGSFRADTLVYVNQTGDLKLESNLEYRFGIFNQLKGALFTDIGNVWLLQPNPAQPGAEFHVRNFYKDLAVGGGLGLRLDFSFFVFRLDLAVPLRDPAKSELDKHWIFGSSSTDSFKDFARKIIYNLAIGYPF